jgi:hypothetical protein
MLTYEDGLLANFIAKKEQIKYEMAVEKINNFVNDLQSKLLSGITVDFGNIGLFRKDITGNLIFKPKEDTSFLPDALGLTSFRFFPLEQMKITNIDFQDNVFPPINKSTVRNWVAAAVIFAFIFIFSIDLKMPEISYSSFLYNLSNHTTILPEYNDVTEVITEDSLVNNLAEFSENNLPENTENTTITSDNYHIIVASYTRYNQAETALKRFKSEDFPNATILDNGNGKIRISLLAFQEKDEAMLIMEEMRTKPQFATIWLLKI